MKMDWGRDRGRVCRSPSSVSGVGGAELARVALGTTSRFGEATTAADTTAAVAAAAAAAAAATAASAAAATATAATSAAAAAAASAATAGGIGLGVLKKTRQGRLAKYVESKPSEAGGDVGGGGGGGSSGFVKAANDDHARPPLRRVRFLEGRL